MLSHEIRRAFLDFFAHQGHTPCPSASLVPNDPTLLFINAGMVPFKDVFTGKEKRPFSRATSSQKCIRISGKHNDLENVGRTARHHTFFEMLGNFSFGDYFKEDAIRYAWELLTRVFGLPQERLIITVFGGDEGLSEDSEARALWRKVSGVPDERIVGMGKADNFWQMGDTGPCGPCSEIHIWNGPLLHGMIPYNKFGEEPSADGRGWFELWNLVFMQFERTLVNGSYQLTPLPAPSIDTGAGLERMASVMQGVSSNYDTDLLRALVDKAAELAQKKYSGSQNETDVSMRVIADHARTAAFLIAEGIFPDRTGREYVLRRVMRRAVRHGHRLGIRRPFLHEVALEVVAHMGGTYPELRERRELITSIIEQEEVRFRETLDRGLRLLDEALDVRVRQGQNTILNGKAAFELYDTYGFPLDLTEVIAQERGFEVDVEGFQKALKEAQEKSKGSVLNKDQAVVSAYHEALSRIPHNVVTFTGYDQEQDNAKVIALVVNGALVDHVAWEGGQGPLPQVDVITENTPFYARGGGQVGDSGEIRVVGGRGRVLIQDTSKPLSGLVVHSGHLAQGEIRVGDATELEVDHEKRAATRRNHSATHLLHWALGHVLGEHAEQKGSLVGPTTLRFDFSHTKPLTQGELERIEELVNHKVLQNEPVLTEALPIHQAREKGAKAIFEEKYGDIVRVLTMTTDSVELCGGTHVRALGDIGLFKIVSETSVAAGVRRIEAITGLNALAFVREQEKLLRHLAAITKTPGGRPKPETIVALTDRVRELEKERADLIRKLTTGSQTDSPLASWLAQARDWGDGVKVLAIETEIADPSSLRELSEQLRDKLGQSVVLVGSKTAGKAMLVLTVTKSLTSRIKANELIRPIAHLVGGTGGGRPDMAQAGGPDTAKLSNALTSLYSSIPI